MLLTILKGITLGIFDGTLEIERKGSTTCHRLHTFWSQSARKQVTLGLSVLVFKGATWEKKSSWETAPTSPRPHGRWVDCKLDPILQVFRMISLKQLQLLERHLERSIYTWLVSQHQKKKHGSTAISCNCFMTHQLGYCEISGVQSGKCWGCSPYGETRSGFSRCDMWNVWSHGFNSPPKMVPAGTMFLERWQSY